MKLLGARDDQDSKRKPRNESQCNSIMAKAHEVDTKGRPPWVGTETTESEIPEPSLIRHCSQDRTFWTCLWLFLFLMVFGYWAFSSSATCLMTTAKSPRRICLANHLVSQILQNPTGPLTICSRIPTHVVVDL